MECIADKGELKTQNASTKLSMNGNFRNHSGFSVRPFDKLRAGSEPVEGFRGTFSVTAKGQSL
jgi:hypothetical protein